MLAPWGTGRLNAIYLLLIGAESKTKVAISQQVQSRKANRSLRCGSAEGLTIEGLTIEFVGYESTYDRNENWSNYAQLISRQASEL